jgi:molybdopterin/thiamine biosynthesis adenylyltransferase
MNLDRYSRQLLYPDLGEEGQKKLISSKVTLIGCGALGTTTANALVRAGVGHLVIADRDFIETNNLQRQVLFDEEDIEKGLPKAEAARRKLEKINSQVKVEARVTDVNSRNIEEIIAGNDLILDGLDNFESRLLVNDATVKHRIPWIYAACISSQGLTMPIIPYETPCLRCIFETAPPPGMTPTCDTAGIVSPIVQIISAIQVMEAIKLLIGRKDALVRHLVSIDAWSGTFNKFNVQDYRSYTNCPTCKEGRFDFLEAQEGTYITSLCGRNSLQITPSNKEKLNFKELKERLSKIGNVSGNKFLLRFSVDEYQITIFDEGRAIIQGTTDESIAKTLYAKYIGL